MPDCKLFAVAISALLLAACAGPMDSHLVTGQGEAAYFARLNPLFAQMTRNSRRPSTGRCPT